VVLGGVGPRTVSRLRAYAFERSRPLKKVVDRVLYALVARDPTRYPLPWGDAAPTEARAEPDFMQFLTAEELRKRRHGSGARVAGLVTCRQRPDTASGVVFVTLEDETGCVNVVVWTRVQERQRAELLGSRLLGVQGTIERDGDVIHMVAARLSDHSALIGPLLAPARNFH